MFGQPLVSVADTVLLFGAQRADLRPSRAAIRKDEALALLRQGSMFFFLAIAIAVGYESDALVISHALGADAVPQFALPYRIVMLAPAAVSLVMVALWPAYSESMARGDAAWAERTMKRSLVVAGCGTVVTSLVVVIVGPYAWSWLGGSSAVPSRGLLLVLGLLACVMSVSTAFGVFLSATGRLRIQVFAAAAMAVSNVILSLALVGPLGVAGPAWGTIIAQTVCVLLPVGFVVGRSLRAADQERTPVGSAGSPQPAMER
jgi:O-antigen/teichoic acid export membrane protein